MRALYYFRQESAKVKKAKEELQGPMVKDLKIIDRQTSAITQKQVHQ